MLYFLQVLMSIIHTVTVAGHRIADCGVRVAREGASFNCEVYIVLTWIGTFLVAIIPLEDLCNRVGPTVIYAR